MINLHNANAYCSEDISDKAIADKEQTWICHHRLEIQNSVAELQMMNLYWHRPASELIFVTKSEHRGVKRTFTEEYRISTYWT